MLPTTSIRPSLGVRIPAITWRRVLLPAPFGPMIARLSPWATSKLTLRSAQKERSSREILVKLRNVPRIVVLRVRRRS